MSLSYLSTEAEKNHRVVDPGRSEPIVLRPAHLRHMLKTKLNSAALVRERTIQTERPPLVGKISAEFCVLRVSRGQHNGSPRPYS
jgi:hypothetical protein